ncbi:ABC transporter permease, partial [Herbaspirillum sp. HC18]
YMMVQGQSNVSTPTVMAGMFAIGLVGLLIDVFLRKAGRIINRRRGLE